MTKTAQQALAQAKRLPKLKALPAPTNCWDDPDVFSKYIFGHTEQIMTELFASINELTPAERVKILHPLLNTILCFRPYVATTNKVSNVESEVESKIAEFLKTDFSKK